MKIIVEWIGEEKVMPFYGYMSPGKLINTPKAVGDSLIGQGLAKLYKPKKQRKEVK
jgi:hypothetical protein